MPNKKRNHEECRRAQCLGCSRKANPKLKLTEELIRRFVKYCYKHYYRDRDFLPLGICDSCKTKLLSQGKSYERELPSFDWETLANRVRNRGVITRAQAAEGRGDETECDCPTCKMAHVSGRGGHFEPSEFLLEPLPKPGGNRMRQKGEPLPAAAGAPAPPRPPPPSRPPPPRPPPPGPSAGPSAGP